MSSHSKKSKELGRKRHVKKVGNVSELCFLGGQRCSFLPSLSTILKSIRFIFKGPPTSSFDLERRRNSEAAWWKTIGPSAYFFFLFSPFLTSSSSLRSRRLIIIISPRSLWGCNLSSHEPRHHHRWPRSKRAPACGKYLGCRWITPPPRSSKHSVDTQVLVHRGPQVVSPLTFITYYR